MADDHHDPKRGSNGLVISPDVIAAIAVTAARDVEGVSALVPRAPEMTRLIRGEYLRFVKLAGTGAELIVEFTLRVRADAKVSAVATGVQRAVKEALQGMTGKTVARVNIKILGADF